MTTVNEAIPYFDELIGLSDDEVKARQNAIAKRRLQRKIASAHDDADSQAMNAQVALDRMYDEIRRSPVNGVDKFDVNSMLAAKAKLAEFLAARDFLREEYKRLFGTELRVE